MNAAEEDGIPDRQRAVLPVSSNLNLNIAANAAASVHGLAPGPALPGFFHPGIRGQSHEKLSTDCGPGGISVCGFRGQGKTPSSTATNIWTKEHWDETYSTRNSPPYNRGFIGAIED